MSTIIPHSQLVQRAIEFILSTLADNPKKELMPLVDEAAMRFNLSPLEVESLLRILNDAMKK